MRCAFVGQALTLLVVLAVGLLFEARRLATPEVLVAVSLRCGLGLATGALLAYALGLDRSLAAVAIVGCAAPVGFGAVVMAERERLDLGLAAAAVSLSGLVALILLPAALCLGCVTEPRSLVEAGPGTCPISVVCASHSAAAGEGAVRFGWMCASVTVESDAITSV